VACLLVAGVLCSFPASAEPAPFDDDDALWKLARKACTGRISVDLPFSDAIGLDYRTRYFWEEREVEAVVIADRDCTRQIDSGGASVVFVLGYINRSGDQYFYKITTQASEILETAFCQKEKPCRAVEPIRVEGGRKIFSEELQENFRTTLERATENWGR